ncbi:dnaJ homolog subfamily C member 10 [Lepeophtheirus salmonis]|uniref:dnaJ homolog subfamily C member 10 n=1 Tax=Lepeophtheirus salmonis TaxID=72036 RepID=UPI001AE87BAF|nr:dnaJ homolog subfamily C member 10-like [Lepeophtheirus salmonis]
MKYVNIFLLVLVHCIQVILTEDYYEILGVEKDADNKAIRKAFKKLALKHHPDKNPNDDEAHALFVKFNKAYETLKDTDKRKRYDLFGEEEDDQKGGGGRGSWKSYEYYDDFGLYDNDELVITLDFNDFRRSVSDTYDYWFINFYNPQCVHCREIAPAWRRLSKKLDGVIRIGAVNCQDSPMLCNSEGIRGFPTLKFYDAHGENQKYYDNALQEDDIMDFVLESLPYNVFRLQSSDFEKKVHRRPKEQPWVIILCKSSSDCPLERPDRILLNHILEDISNIAIVDCSSKKMEMCREKLDDEEVIVRTGIYRFRNAEDVLNNNGIRIESTDYKEIAHAAMKQLPKPKSLDTQKFRMILNDLEERSSSPWLIHFIYDEDDEMTLDEDRKINSLIRKANMALVDCKAEFSVCSDYQIRKSVYALFKPGKDTPYEINYGREKAPDVLNFARSATNARTMTSITGQRLENLLKKPNSMIFVDFFSPHCSPCLNFLPEFRKASVLIGGSIKFVSVDCTKNPTICNKFNIRAYPTGMYFNGSITDKHLFHGSHRDQEIADFVMDIVRPKVVTLDERVFKKLIYGQSPIKTIVIDFYANWCGPCMQMAPEWNKLGRLFSENPTVMIAKVDCEEHRDFCDRQAVRSYPSMRIYTDPNKYFIFTGLHREAFAFRDWVYKHMITVAKELDDSSLQNLINKSYKQPVVVDFYAPWCGPCQRLAPKFEEAALSLQAKGVIFGKVNCDYFRHLCGRHHIQAYPTLLLYRNGHPEDLETSFNTESIINAILKIVEDDTDSGYYSSRDEL